jgi:hypothetical protein
MALIPLPVRLVYRLTFEFLGTSPDKIIAPVQAFILITLYLDLFLGLEGLNTPVRQ